MKFRPTTGDAAVLLGVVLLFTVLLVALLAGNLNEWAVDFWRGFMELLGFDVDGNGS